MFPHCFLTNLRVQPLVASEHTSYRDASAHGCTTTPSRPGNTPARIKSILDEQKKKNPIPRRRLGTQVTKEEEQRRRLLIPVELDTIGGHLAGADPSPPCACGKEKRMGSQRCFVALFCSTRSARAVCGGIGSIYFPPAVRVK